MTFKSFYSTLKSAKNVAIFGHVNPDPDVFGSMFSMKEVCHRLGVNAQVFAVVNADKGMKNLFPMQEIRTDFFAKDYDLVVFVDMHALKRLDSCFVEQVKAAKRVLILDHHTVTKEEGVYSEENLIDSKSAATCELLTELLVENGVEIDKKLATYLYTGLVSDTNRFLNNNTDLNVFKTAAKLIECGANMRLVNENMFLSCSIFRLKFKKTFIEKIKLIHDGKVAYAYFTQKEMKKYGVCRDDVKEQIDLLLSIDGVQTSFLLIESEKNHFRCSMRSSEVDCRPLAVTMNGGGHKNAVGFDVDARPSQLRKKISTWAEEILK